MHRTYQYLGPFTYLDAHIPLSRPGQCCTGFSIAIQSSTNDGHARKRGYYLAFSFISFVVDFETLSAAQADHLTSNANTEECLDG